MSVFLVPVDGSDYSNRALDYVIGRCRGASGQTVHVINVQAPIVTVNVKLFVSAESLQTYYRDEGTKVVEPAVARLKAAGIDATPHIIVGEAGKVIADFSGEIAAEEIVMGSHGRGALAGALVGSVAQKVVHLAKIPVVLVK